MKRILFIDHANFVGGGQLGLEGHLRHLDATRYEAHLASTEIVPEMVERFRAAGARLHFPPIPRLRGGNPLTAVRLPHAAWHLRRLVREQGIDLVVGNTPRAAYLGTLALAGSGTPLVWWIRDFNFGRGFVRAFRRSADRIVCVSDAIRAFYGGADDPRFEVVYVGSGTHEQLTRHTEADVARERRRWGIEPDDVLVGFMGRLVHEKGPEDLVDAAERLSRTHPRLRLLMVGTGRGQEGDVEEALRRRVRERGLEGVVVFTGYQSEEALYYRMFDLFVLSTRIREALPTSAIQAMMAGKPVVATATGGTPELVVDRETGLLVPPSDPGALAAAIGALLEDRELAAALAERGRARAMASHREESTTASMERIYADLLGERPAEEVRGRPAAAEA